MSQAINGGEVRWVISADSQQFDEALAKAKSEASSLGAELSKMDSASPGVQAQKNIQREAEKTSVALRGMVDSFKSIGLGSAQATFGSLSTMMAGMASKGLNLGSTLESNKLSFKALTGSADGARTVLTSVAEFASENPFQMLDVSNVAKELVAMSVPAGKISEHLNTIGNVAVASGGSLQGIGHVFAQISAQGKLTTQDMYQLVNQGVAIMPALARTTGKSMDQVREDMSKGKISFDVFTNAMKNIVPEDMAKELREEMGNTIPRQLDRLKGSLSTFATEFVGINKKTGEKASDGLAQGYTNVLKSLADSLRSPALIEAVGNLGRAITPVLNAVAQTIPKIVDVFGKGIGFIAKNSSLLIPVGGALLTMFTGLGSSLPIIGPVLGNINGGIMGLVKSFRLLWSANPMLAGLIGVLVVGFASAMKNSETFRASISRLFSSLATLARKLMPVFEMLGKTLVSVIANPAVIGILEVVALAISHLASAIASVPTPALMAIVTALGTFALLSTSPILGVGLAIGIVISALIQLQQQTDFIGHMGNFITSAFNNIAKAINDFAKFAITSFNDFINGAVNFGKSVVDAIRDLPKNASITAHNFIVGLMNGISDGADKVIQYVADLGNAMIRTINSVLDIHSPSREMRKVGNFTTLGLAEGIQKGSSVVEKAMDNLATDMLEWADKAISNRKDFKLIDVNGVYKDWKKVSQLFTKGSKQYENAIKKMEDARLAVNQKIFSLQDSYNSKLDETKARINGLANIFTKLEPKGSGMDGFMMVDNINEQTAALNDWAKDIEALNNTGLDPRFIQELAEMGIEAAHDIKHIASMTSDQIGALNDAWLKKQEASNRTAVAKLTVTRKDTLSEIAKISEGIDGETIKVADQGGRLVSSISDGITGALPTLDSSLGKLQDYISKAVAESAKSGGAGSGAGGAGAGIAEKLAGGLKLDKPKALESLKLSAEEMGKNLLGMLGGVLAGVFAFKKLGKFFKGKQALSGVGQAITESVSTLKAPIEKTGALTQSLTNAGQQMTKGQQAMATMRSGIFNIILLAGAIAAMALALKFANDQMPDDLGPLVLKIGVMSLAVGAMGGLAFLAGKLKIGLEDLLPLAGIAGVIALTGLALGLANAMIPDDLGLFSLKLAVMGIAVVAMGALAVVAGILSSAIGPGLLMIAGIAGVIALSGIALGIANFAIPDNLEQLRDKLVAMGVAITAVGVLAGVIGAIMATGVGAGVLIAGLTAMLGITGAMVLVALGIKEINDKTPNDIGMVKAKVDLIRDSLQHIASASVGNLLSNAAQALNMAPLAVIVNAYADIATNLFKISVIPINKESVTHKVNLIKDTIESISKTDADSPAGLITTAVNNFINAVNTVILGQVVKTYADIAMDLMKIQMIVLNPAVVLEKVQLIKSVVEKVSSEGQDFVGAMKNALVNWANAGSTESAAKIIGIYSNMSDSLKKIEGLNFNEETIKERVGSLNKIVSEVLAGNGAGGLFGAIKNFFAGGVDEGAITKATSIIRKMGEFGQALNGLTGLNPAVETNVKNIKSVLGQVGDIRGDYGDLGHKEWVIGMAVSMVRKLGEFATSANALPAVVDLTAKLAGITGAMSQIFSSVTETINAKIAEFTTSGTNLANAVLNGIRTVFPTATAVASELQANFWRGLESKMNDEFLQGQALGNKVVEGIKSVLPAMAQAGRDTQGAYWNALQAKLPDEYHQGVALANEVKKGANSVRFEDSGTHAVNGFINGAKSRDVYSVGWDIANRFLQGIKKRGDEHSPWRTTYQSGVFAGEGLAEGIEASEKGILNTANSLVDNVVGVFNGADANMTATMSTLYSTGTTGSASSSVENFSGSSSGSGVVINQTNNNYTQYSLEQMNRDLQWQLRKV